MPTHDASEMQSPRLGDDLMVGVAAISLELGQSQRRVNYLLTKGDLPGFKHGGKWCLRRSTLLAFFHKLETRGQGQRAG